MNHFIQFLILIFTLLLSLVLSPLTIPYARKLSIMDEANHRSSHVGITPRGGGIVFVLVFYIGIICSYLLGYLGTFNISLIVLLFGSLFMAVIGWFDDFMELSVEVRFAVQIITVVISTLFLPKVWTPFPMLIEKAVFAFAWLWFINLFNFMDGTDGYAVQEAFFICLGLFLLGLSIGNIAVILGSSVLGFLRVNYPRAKIFMGDVGSIFLGYLLGGFILYSIALNQVSILGALILTSLFSFDATYTLIKRTLQRKKIWQSHREHWYQRLNIFGITHKVIFYIGVIYNLIIICLLFLNKHYNISIIIPFTISCCILSSTAWYVKRKETQKKS